MVGLDDVIICFLYLNRKRKSHGVYRQTIVGKSGNDSYIDSMMIFILAFLHLFIKDTLHHT